MGTTTITLRLNPQQRELLERTVSGGAAASLEDLVRLAIRERATENGIASRKEVPDA